jgi:hypothetical protein
MNPFFTIVPSYILVELLKFPVRRSGSSLERLRGR